MDAAVPTLPVRSRRSQWLARVGVFGVLLLGIGLWQRERISICYLTNRLEAASVDHKTAYALKLADHGPAATSSLVSLFRSDDVATCRAAREGIEGIWKALPEGDASRTEVTGIFFEMEPRFSTPGRSAGLDLLPSFLGAKNEQLLDKAKAMLTAAIKSESVDLRLQALASCMRPEFDSIDLILPLMNDSSVDVRRAAILALGPPRDQQPVITDDELLNWLHDQDPEVRRLCEMSLRSRGRSPRDIHLGRLYTSPQPSVRQKLLLELAEEDELDVTVWLERLTGDNDPAVRAGAIRVAADRQASLLSRLMQMGKNDPDATVRRIAAYYSQKMAQQQPK